MRSDESALKAFELIDSRNISGVAVVDADGGLVAATSGRDLDLFLRDHTIDLAHLTIVDYLALHAQPQPLVSGSFDDTLKAVVERIAAACSDERVCHRAFLVDSDRRPVGVVSLKDALDAIIQQ